MAYFDKYGVEFSDDRTTLVKCPMDYQGEYIIPNGITNIGSGAFSGCTGLTSVTIPNSVTNVGSDAFEGCTSLPVIDNIRYADTYLVEAVNKSQSSYTIKDGTKWIGSHAFEGCTGLTSVTIPNSVTSIGGSAFSGCTGLTSPVYNAHVFAYMPTTYAGAYAIPDEIETIASDAFRNCTGLTSMTIPNSVTSIRGSAFSGCTGLTSVTIPNSVSSIGEWAFHNCTSLTSVNIGNSVIHIGNNAFESCTSLTSVTIPNSVSSIGNSAFYYCTSLTSVTIGNHVTSIGWNAFRGCSGLTSVTIPDSVTSIGSFAFYECSQLQSINVDALNPNYCSVDGVLFNKDKTTLIDCPIGKQGEYIIPNCVTSIGSSAFSGCSGLTSVTIPNSVTSIEYGAFSGCTGLTSILVPFGQEERFCEMAGLKDYADVIQKTSEQQTKFYEKPFAEMLSFNIDQLHYRYRVLQRIDINDPQRKQEYLMVFDSFLVLFRALFLENGNKQYSVQNYFIEKGQPEKAQAINDFLDTLVFEWRPNLTIRIMLKFIADKFICHADPISKEDLAQSNFYMSHLSNPYTKNNLQSIMNEINALIQ